MKVYMGMEVDPNNLPENFNEIIKNAFEKFTKGTSKEYRVEDQLRFIDNVVYHINGAWGDGEILDSKIVEYMEDTWREYEEFAKEEDIYCREFLEECIATGRERAKLHGNFGKSQSENKAIKEMLARIIKAVFEEETNRRCLFERKIEEKENIIFCELYESVIKKEDCENCQRCTGEPK